MYKLPADEVVRVVDASATPFARLSPDGERMLLIHYTSVPPLQMVAEPFHRLAGLRIDARTGTTRRLYNLTRVSVGPVEGGERVDVALPAHLRRISSVEWSPCARRFALCGLSDEGLELWVVDVDTLEPRRLGDFVVNDTMNCEFFWMPGGDDILACAVPAGRGEAPVKPLVPDGPIIQESGGTVAQNRTYQDLLESPHDDALFAHLTTSQLVLVAADGSGEAEPLGTPRIFNGLAPSPDGEHLYVNTLTAPFSHVVPVDYFGRTTEIWSLTGGEPTHLSDSPAADALPIMGVPTWPRGARWLADEPATLRWCEALDGGDPKAEVEHRDRVMLLRAPFEAPVEAFRTAGRFRGAYTLSMPGHLITYEYDWKRRWVTASLRDIRDAEAAPRVLFDRSVHDRYADRGSPISRRQPNGYYIVEVEDGKIWMSGAGASDSGDKPFVDRLDLDTLESERVLESTDAESVSFSGFGRSASGAPSIVVRRQSPTANPNYGMVDLDGANPRPLTAFPNPHPELTDIERRILRYERADGVPLSGTLYLPPGRTEGEALPLVLWAYPREYNDASTAGQIRTSTNTFTRLGGTSPLMFLTQGYAVLADAAMPIIGDPETMNDTFLDQLTSSAAAAIDAAAATGLVDPERVGVGGHSYGAFMVANLLAHTDLFRAGIARSGAYNRSLTPYGFQGERRTLWQATDTYIEVSPLFSAHKIEDPILLIHGAVDNNSGTYPLQSKRLFHALKGQGARARLVMLPHESHGYRARASLLHVLAESFEWFDAHVKNAGPRPEKREEE